MVFWRRWIGRLRRSSTVISMTEFTENVPFIGISSHDGLAMLQLPHLSGVILQSFQPKCLPNVDYSSFLHDGVENFSSECWLENYLHRFAQPDSFQNCNSDTLSSSSRSNTSSGTCSECTSVWSSSQGTLRLGSFSSDWWNSFIDSNPPPPYSEEPPPTYEEAVQDNPSRWQEDNNFRDDFCW